MKKLFLVGALALVGAMNAQKNTLLVGGNVSLGTAKTTNTISGIDTEGKVNAFSFNPTVGYQFTDNLTAGVKFGIGNEKVTTKATGSGVSLSTETKTDMLQYGVFGRYTMPLNETFAVFGELDVFANNGKITETGEETIKTNGFGVMFTPNLFINFKNSFGLNFNIGGLGYTTEKTKGTNEKTNAFGFEFGKGVTVGISKNFGLK